MDIGILAIQGKYALSGILCVGAIICLIVAIIPYTKGPITGASSNFILCLIFIFSTNSPNPLDDYTEEGFISNESQTKWLNIGHTNINDNNCIFFIRDQGTVDALDDIEIFIPADEMEVIDGWFIMKSTGKRYTDDDYYIYNVVYPSVNAPIAAGGGGIPQWLWHPAAPIWVFGLFSLPAFGAGAVLHNKLS